MVVLRHLKSRVLSIFICSLINWGFNSDSHFSQKSAWHYRRLSEDAIENKEGEMTSKSYIIIRRHMAGIIKKRRIKLKLTMEQLSKKAGISVSQLEDIERANAKLTFLKFCDLTKALGIYPYALSIC